MPDREDKFWESVHNLDKRVSKTENDIDTLKSLHNDSLTRHDVLEEKFNQSLEQLSQALTGIDKKLESFITKMDTVAQVKDKLWGYGLTVAGLFAGGLGFLFIYWVEHAAK